MKSLMNMGKKEKVQRDHDSLLFLQSDPGLGKGKELETSENEIPKPKAQRRQGAVSPLLKKVKLMGSYMRLLRTVGPRAQFGTVLEWEAMYTEGGNVFYCFFSSELHK